MSSAFANCQPGDALPALSLPPVTRHTLALYCGGSGDHNPLHTDIDFAREQADLDDVIAHGMLIKAWVGRMLTDWAPIGSLAEFQTRFRGMTHVGDVITCSGQVRSREAGRIQVTFTASKADGSVVADGTAVFRDS